MNEYVRRKCKNPKCENAATSDTGVGSRARLCAECYGKRIIMQARTSRMQHCACGNIAPLGGTICARCEREARRGRLQPVEDVVDDGAVRRGATGQDAGAGPSEVAR